MLDPKIENEVFVGGLKGLRGFMGLKAIKKIKKNHRSDEKKHYLCGE